ncbi:XRE family transcriptional regulator [Apibacter muscae]|uniref:XRE family transcriptional regulator n=1 Tax=Apibacter muscae TaxID=2509004 RepID=A0A563DKN1_9FLAO|nr:helix-turn-helix transcriptional regulator [Apibacter muscae]TWP25434.1 XRE family transcriptional regulator [Apibacter muscae]TWP30818.1 XRE family transcriptional regulator [Apibacter muscae]TWP31360.1 XRE family transcriptional regulator [Apibacter muscae]
MGLGNRIISLRKVQKLSQGDLASKIGVHQNVLGRYERGEAKPSIEMASKIADCLGVSIDYLVGKIDVEIDKVILDKIIAIQKLPEEDKSHIMYSLDGLIQHAKNRLAYK